jgi:S-adenosylmethionine decarboxylase
MQTIHFGEHLTLDGYRGNFQQLNNQHIVKECLYDLPERLGMTRLSDPQVYFAQGNAIKDPGGWSGYVIIMESHISIHTFPQRGFASIDIYTCKNGMNTHFIISYFKEIFHFEEIETNFIMRGRKYPIEDIYPSRPEYTENKQEHRLE